jgi:pimeloyl-ACP methyl ester carboxylesterase
MEKNSGFTKLRLRTILLFTLCALFCLTANAQDLKHLRSFMQSRPSSMQQVPYGNNTAAGHYLNTGDAKIYYEVYGKGKTIVILHGGILGSTFEMAQLIDSLSKNFQVIAISTRGHGKSEMGKSSDYPRKAKDVYEIIKANTNDSVTVLGFSDGGYTGYYLAGTYPEKVKKLITIGAGEWVRGSRTFKLTSGEIAKMDPLYWKQQLALMPDPTKVNSWLSMVSTYYNTLNVGKAEFEKVHCPVLLMAGELDQNAPLKTVIAAYTMLPHAQLAIIHNASHPAFQVNFPAVWACIIPFLN